MATTDVPLTFEARGAFAQLGNRSLKLARLRPGESGRPMDLEVIVPNAIGRRGQLVVPLAKLSEFTQLDGRDSALHYEIKTATLKGAPDPFLIRDLRLKVDQRNGITEQAKTDAKSEAEGDVADRFRTRLSFVAQMTREAGTRMSDRFMASASTERLMEFVQKKEIGGVRIDIDELTKRVILLTAQHIGGTPADIEKRLEQLADLAMPFGTVGLATARKTDGFLIRQRHRLAALIDGLKEKRDNASSAAIAATENALPRLVQVLEFVDARLEAVNKMFADLSAALKDWDMTIARITQARRGAGWGLDGWYLMSEAWEEAKIMARKFESADPLDRNIVWIEQNAPLLPRHEWDPKRRWSISTMAPFRRPSRSR